ncbi:MAG: putative quinol monooxygenase [Pirellulales bacterium]|nr:putative quinol monooxygenase [Pirellulales bacterium]
MLQLHILLTVKQPDDIAKVRELLGAAARLSRTEPGCLRFEASQSVNDPSLFILNEHWVDQAALDVHRTAQAYTTIYQPQVLPLVTRVAHPSALLE